jgi:hypothetical protein
MSKYVIVGVSTTKTIVVVGNKNAGAFYSEEPAQKISDKLQNEHPEYDFVVIPVQAAFDGTHPVS